jgi:hypothetical protein
MKSGPNEMMLQYEMRMSIGDSSMRWHVKLEERAS